MKPLETSQRVLTWLCGYPPDKSETKRMKIAYIAFTLSVITGHLLTLLAGAAFIYKHVSVNLEETLFSLFHTVGSLSMLYQSIGTIVLRRNLMTIFEGLSRIYSESK